MVIFVEYVMATCHIFGHFLILSKFGMLYQEKSGNPDSYIALNNRNAYVHMYCCAFVLLTCMYVCMCLCVFLGAGNPIKAKLIGRFDPKIST
jgi:hypothetical protein